MEKNEEKFIGATEKGLTAIVLLWYVHNVNGLMPYQQNNMRMTCTH